MQFKSNSKQSLPKQSLRRRWISISNMRYLPLQTTQDYHATIPRSGNRWYFSRHHKWSKQAFKFLWAIRILNYEKRNRIIDWTNLGDQKASKLDRRKTIGSAGIT